MGFFKLLGWGCSSVVQCLSSSTSNTLHSILMLKHTLMMHIVQTMKLIHFKPLTLVVFFGAGAITNFIPCIRSFMLFQSGFTAPGAPKPHCLHMYFFWTFHAVESITVWSSIEHVFKMCSFIVGQFPIDGYVAFCQQTAL